MPGVVFQSGERVTLRTIEKEDTEVLQRARNEPDFQRGLLFRYPANQTMVETFIEEWLRTMTTVYRSYFV